MKSISLTIKVHIPVLYHKHPFSEIKPVKEFIDYRQNEIYVKKVAEHKLLPFIESAQRIRHQFGSRFNLGLSISGLSLRLFEK